MLLSEIGQYKEKGNDRVLCFLTDSILLIKDVHYAWLSKPQPKTNQTNTFTTLLVLRGHKILKERYWYHM